MKRGLLAFLILIALIVVAGLIVARFFLGSILKRGVESVGPTITKVDVKLDSASLALFSGNGELKGLVVGNPPGYKTPSSLRFGSIGMDAVPTSLLGDKVIIHTIRIQNPEITLEGNLQGNNLSKLLENIRGENKSSGPSSSSTQSTSRKIQVDDLSVTGGKINLVLDVLGTRSATVSLPEIRLTNLGQGPEGITAAELSEKLLKAILESATQAATSQITSLGKDLGKAAQNLGTGSVQQIEKVTKGLGDLLKKK